MTARGPILVTGAAGFIGHAVSERLLARGERVIGLDNFTDYYDVALKKARTARLAIGIPDYEAYVAHMRDRHAGHPPMDRDAFMLDRMQAKYGRGRARCC